MNKFIFTGNLTKDPESGETQNGTKYAKFTVAVSRNYTNSDGNRETDFFDVTVWRERAELCEKYLAKGKKVGIVAKVQFRTYEDENGNKRKVTDIVVDEIEFLSPKPAEESQEKPKGKSNSKKKSVKELEPIDTDDLPF